MLQKRGSREAQEDLKDMGKIVLECLEPDTFLHKGSFLKSQSWESVVVDFVESTKCKSAQFLLQVSLIINVLMGPKDLTMSSTTF